MKFILSFTILHCLIGLADASCTGHCLEDLKALRTMEIQKRISEHIKTLNTDTDEGASASPKAMLNAAKLGVNRTSTEDRPHTVSYIPSVMGEQEIPLSKFTLTNQQQRQEILEAHINVKLLTTEVIYGESVKVVVRVYEQSMHRTEIGSKIVFVSGETRAWIPLEDTRFLKKGHGIVIEALVDGLNIVANPNQAADPLEDSPFLKVTFAERRGRSTRSADSLCRDPEYKGCCVRKLKIKTSFLGGKISSPKEVIADMCSGDCELNHHHMPKNDYHNLLAQAKYKYANSSLPICCHPTEYDNLKVLISMDNGQVIQQTLPNIIVKKCGCM